MEHGKFKAIPMAEFLAKHWKEGGLFTSVVLDCGPDGLWVVVPKDLVEGVESGDKREG